MVEEQNIFTTLKNDLDNCESLEQWKQLKSVYLNKSEFLLDIKKQLSNATPDQKKDLGLRLKSHMEMVNTLLNEKRIALENIFLFDDKDNHFLKNNLVEPQNKQGIKHPITKMQEILSLFFDGLGFKFELPYEIETDEVNFTLLNIPKNHPARAMQDTFYLSDDRVLRTHATNMTSRSLLEMKEPFSTYSFGRVYRNDDIDASHSIQFNQLDLLSVSDTHSIATLKWTIVNLLKHVFPTLNDGDLLIRSSYFPFTEPSFEVDIKLNNSWMEILGCGMINNNVFRLTNSYTSKTKGFAFGIGIERLAMLKWGIKDIREFTNNDLEYLRKLDLHEN